jgi:hypothetical protein
MSGVIRKSSEEKFSYVTIQKRALSHEERGLKNNNEKKNIQKKSFFKGKVEDDSNDLWTNLDMVDLGIHHCFNHYYCHCYCFYWCRYYYYFYCYHYIIIIMIIIIIVIMIFILIIMIIIIITDAESLNGRDPTPLTVLEVTIRTCMCVYTCMCMDLCAEVSSFVIVVVKSCF